MTNAEKYALSNYKKFKLTSPTGEETITENLNEFCKQHNLDEREMLNNARSGCKSKSGWNIEVKRVIAIKQAKFKIGDSFENAERPFTIIGIHEPENSKDQRTFTIRFTNTGSVRVISCKRFYSKFPIADTTELRRGTSELLHGVGYRGDNYCNRNLSDVEKRMFHIWSGMLLRCYNSKSKMWEGYGGRGVTVDTRWHNFDNFKHDLPLLDGYDEKLWLANRLDLDKDLKQRDVKYKVYSKDTCVLLLRKENIKLVHAEAYKVTKDTGAVLIVRNLVDFCRENSIVYDEMVSAIHRGHLLDNGWKVERLD